MPGPGFAAQHCWEGKGQEVEAENLAGGHLASHQETHPGDLLRQTGSCWGKSFPSCISSWQKQAFCVWFLSICKLWGIMDTLREATPGQMVFNKDKKKKAKTLFPYTLE